MLFHYYPVRGYERRECYHRVSVLSVWSDQWENLFEQKGIHRCNKKTDDVCTINRNARLTNADFA